MSYYKDIKPIYKDLKPIQEQIKRLRKPEKEFLLQWLLTLVLKER